MECGGEVMYVACRYAAGDKYSKNTRQLKYLHGIRIQLQSIHNTRISTILCFLLSTLNSDNLKSYIISKTVTTF
jgi:hypothetical protein